MRTGLPHTGHSDADGSVNDWTSSNFSPHSGLVQAYWYVGMDTSSDGRSGPAPHGLALTGYDC